MAGVNEAFPFAPLGESDVHRIMGLCGGEPTQMEGLRSFLAASGREGMPQRWFRYYVSVLGADCLDALDVGTDAAPVNLNRGALLYAGVASEVGVFRPLPLRSEVLRRLNDIHRLNLAMTIAEAASDIPSFDDVLDRFRDVLMRDSGRGAIQAARLGAGLLHLITTESANYVEVGRVYKGDVDSTVREAAILELGQSKTNEPAEFADLKMMFDTAEWPDALA